MARLSAETEQVRTLIGQAAMLRALGAPWREVAEAVGRSESTVRHWPSEHRQTWQAEYRSAYRQVVEEAGSEAIATLRQQMQAEGSVSRLYRKLGTAERAKIAWRAANTIAFTLLRLRQHEAKAKRGEPADSRPSEFDGWSVEELVEEADRQGIPVPECLRQRIAGENPGPN